MILEKFNLEGKVAVVTGCSRLNCLGFGMAEGLAEAGADVVGVGPGNMAAARNRIESLGRSFLAIEADLRSIEPVEAVVEEVMDRLGRIDILVNNSGIIIRNQALKFTEEEWDEVLNINLKSMFFLSQAAAREFVKARTGGKIINTASLLSFQGGILVPSYTASKHGVAGITRALANEWARYKINVNAIAPGYMATDNTAPLREDKERNKAILDRIPAGRWGKNEDLKGLVVFLVSAASDYLNGAVINVDGGWLAR